MTSKFDSIKKELDDLIKRGDLLFFALVDNVGELPDNIKKNLEKKKIKLPIVITDYDTWYTEALQVIKQIIPGRYDDFVKQYKNEKRKEVDFLTYGISDYLLGLKTTKGDEVIAEQKNAIPKLQRQNSILQSAKRRFESTLFDLKEVLQADLFDSELEAAKELLKKGFMRGSGAIAGVVLEKHLRHICENHEVKSKKINPSISDYNQLLKDGGVIEMAK